MRALLLAFTLSAGLGLYAQAVNATPASTASAAIAKSSGMATQPSALQQVQYREHRTRHGIVKCYRDFIIGPYRCHYYRNPLRH